MRLQCSRRMESASCQARRRRHRVSMEDAHCFACSACSAYDAGRTRYRQQLERRQSSAPATLADVLVDGTHSRARRCGRGLAEQVGRRPAVGAVAVSGLHGTCSIFVEPKLFMSYIVSCTRAHGALAPSTDTLPQPRRTPSLPSRRFSRSSTVSRKRCVACTLACLAERAKPR
jgi:hypothetical protein